MIAIILGAFGAHGLEKLITKEKIENFEVGVRYQFYMAFLLLIIGVSSEKFNFSTKLSTRLLLCGCILFSGSIYLLSLEEVLKMKLSFLGPITPLGGTLMIAGIGIFIIKLFKK